MAFINVWRLSSGSWTRAFAAGGWKMDPASGTEKATKRAWRCHAGAWEFDIEWTVPSVTPTSPAISLQELPGRSDARVTWTAITDTTDDRYYYDVKVVWYRNGTATTTNVVAQSAGANTSPSSVTWAVGDVVHCVICFQTAGMEQTTGPTWTSGNVTLDSGTSGG